MSGTSDKSPIYRLYGVVVHLDIMNAAFSGHYVCYVKNMQNKWFKIDDSTVCSQNLLGSPVYILYPLLGFSIYELRAMNYLNLLFRMGG